MNETVVKRFSTDIHALESLKSAFDSFYNDAIKNAYESGKDSRVKMDMAEMVGICQGMLERTAKLSVSI